MGDPVTMAVIGASAGAMMNRKDPLKGALLGAAGGYAGGSLAPMFSSAAPTAATSTLTGGSTAAASTAANAALPTAAFTGQSIVPAVSSAPFAMNPIGSAALGGINPVTAAGPSTGLIPSSLVQPSFMDTVTGGIKDIGQFAQQNPVLTQMAAQTGASLLNQQPTLPPPAGLMRGNPTQTQPPQYQVGVPRVSLI